MWAGKDGCGFLMYVKAVLLKMCSAKSGFSDKTLLGNVYYFLSWKLSMYISTLKDLRGSTVQKLVFM